MEGCERGWDRRRERGEGREKERKREKEKEERRQGRSKEGIGLSCIKQELKALPLSLHPIPLMGPKG